MANSKNPTLDIKVNLDLNNGKDVQKAITQAMQKGLEASRQASKREFSQMAREAAKSFEAISKSTKLKGKEGIFGNLAEEYQKLAKIGTLSEKQIQRLNDLRNRSLKDQQAFLKLGPEGAENAAKRRKLREEVKSDIAQLKLKAEVLKKISDLYKTAGLAKGSIAERKQAADAMALLRTLEKVTDQHRIQQAQIQQSAKARQEAQKIEIAQQRQIEAGLKRQNQLLAEQEKIAKKQAELASRIARGNQITAQRGGVQNLQAQDIASVKGGLLARRSIVADKLAQAQQLGDARLYAAASRGLTNIDKQLAAVNARGREVNITFSQMAGLFKQFARFAIGYASLYELSAAIKQVVVNLVDLEKEMKSIQAITTSSDSQMAGLSATIKRVAVESQFSTTEVAKSAKVLAQAGVAADEMSGALNAVVKFASATDSSLETSADIITSYRAVYKDLSDSKIADQLTKAVNISKLSADDLQTILSLGAQTAKDYNLTSEQYLAAVTTLRNAGIKASTVATGLRQATTELFAPDTATLAALEQRYAEIGEGEKASQAAIKQMFANFQRSGNPLLSAIGELKRIGFSGEGQLTLGRGYDIRSVNALIALVDNFKELAAAEKQVTFGRATAEAADIQMRSLSNSLKQMSTSFTVFGDAVFGGGVETLASFVDQVTESINALTKLDAKLKSSGSSFAEIGTGTVIGGATAGAAVGARYAGGGIAGKVVGAGIGAGVGVAGGGALASAFDADTAEVIGKTVGIIALIATVVSNLRKGVQVAGKGLGLVRTLAAGTGWFGGILLAIEAITIIANAWPESKGTELKRKAEAAAAAAEKSQADFEERLAMYEEFNVKAGIGKVKEGTTADSIRKYGEELEALRAEQVNLFGSSAAELTKTLQDYGRQSNAAVREKLLAELNKQYGKNLTDQQVYTLALHFEEVQGSSEAFIGQIADTYRKLGEQLKHTEDEGKKAEIRKQLAVFNSDPNIQKMISGEFVGSAQEVYEIVYSFSAALAALNDIAKGAGGDKVKSLSAQLQTDIQAAIDSGSAEDMKARISAAVNGLAGTIEEKLAAVDEAAKQIGAGKEGTLGGLRRGAVRRNAAIDTSLGILSETRSGLVSAADVQKKKSDADFASRNKQFIDASSEFLKLQASLTDAQLQAAGLNALDIQRTREFGSATSSGSNLSGLLKGFLPGQTKGEGGEYTFEGDKLVGTYANQIQELIKKYYEGIKANVEGQVKVYMLTEEESALRSEIVDDLNRQLEEGDYEGARKSAAAKNTLDALEAKYKVDKRRDDLTDATGSGNLTKIEAAKYALKKAEENELRVKEAYVKKLLEINDKELKHKADLADSALKKSQALAVGGAKGVISRAGAGGAGESSNWLILETQYKAAADEYIATLMELANQGGANAEEYRAQAEQFRKNFKPLAEQEQVMQDYNDSVKAQIVESETKRKALTYSGSDEVDAYRNAAGLGFTTAQSTRFNMSQLGIVRDDIARDTAIKFDPKASADAKLEAQERLNGLKQEELELTAKITYENRDLVSQIGDLATDTDSWIVALENGANSIKGLGERIRTDVVTAWDDVGDAMANAILHGEDFNDQLEQIINNLANTIFTDMLKTGMNALITGQGFNQGAPGEGGGLFGMIGGLFGASSAPTGGTPGTAAPPEGGGGGLFGGLLGGLFGKKPGGAAGAAGAAVSAMNVQAQTVNINGATGGVTPTGIIPGGNPNSPSAGEQAQQGFFSGLMDSLTGAFDGLIGSLGGLFSGLFGGGGGGGQSDGDILTGLAMNAAMSYFGGGAGGAAARTGGIIQGFARGGIIRGRGTGTSDSISGVVDGKSGKRPIRVSNGEAILNKKAVDTLGPGFVHAVNSGSFRRAAQGMINDSAKSTSKASSGVDRFVKSGGGGDGASVENQLRITNVLDPSVTKQYMETRAGEKVILNILKKNGMTR